MASLSRTIGNYEAVISVAAPGSVTVAWEGAGKTLKTVPPLVKTDHAEEYTELKDLKKSIESSIKVQKTRIEKFLIERRSMPFSHWLKNFSEHPLVGAVCINLVWVFSTKPDQFTAMYIDQNFVNEVGLEIDVRASEVESVELWHPLMADSSNLNSWQRFALERDLDQPFKQIFREHFRDFPRSLGSLFQGIWVRQHQFRKLLVDLGWSYSFRGNFENFSGAIKNFNDSLHCELDVESEGDLYSSRGICLAVGLGKINLYEGEQVIELSALSPQVASEVMREIDFVVSVSALGNTEDWIQLCRDLEDSNRVEFTKYLNSDKTLVSYAKRSANESELAFMSQLFGVVTNAYSRLPVFKTIEARASILKLLLGSVPDGVQIEFDKRYVYIRGNVDRKICFATGLVYRLPESSIDMELSKSHVRSKERVFSDQLSSQIHKKVELIIKEQS